jgi:predicted branched-subunit amino acid permease
VSPGRAAIAEGWPVFVTTAFVGIAFGLTGRQSGLSIVETSAASVIVFAGASAVAIVVAGALAPLIAFALRDEQA